MKRTVVNVLFLVMAALYIFLMSDLFFRFNVIFDANRVIARSYNLVPFKTIGDYLRGRYDVASSFAVSNILGNIVVFIPCGLYLAVAQKRKAFVTSLATVLVISIAIEAIQYAFGLGASDIDDVLLNGCGGLLGITGYRGLKRAFGDEGRAKTAITVISLVIGIPIVYLYFTTVFNHLRL